MRILLINQYAGAPTLGMEYRPHWMATEWQKLGHEVLIVAGDQSHLRRAQPSAGRSTVEGVDFLTLRTPHYGENGPRRFANILAFRLQLMRATKTLCRWRPDVVIASSTHPMDIRPGLRIARKSGALFVHEVHDLWPLTPKLLGGMSDRHPMIMWMQREEDLACRNADLVVSMLPATLPYLESRGLDADRWVYVSNGVPVEAVGDTDDPQGEGPFRVGYFGSHGISNDLSTLVDAARLLKDRPIEFHLTGSGPLKPDLEHQATGLDNFFFHDQVPPAKAREQMQTMDALFMAVPDSPLYDHGIGLNKMFEYMATGRPIIQAIRTPASPVSLAGCGVTCDPSNPTDLVRAIADLMSKTSMERDALGKAGRAYVESRATHPKLASRFIEAAQCARRRQERR